MTFDTTCSFCGSAIVRKAVMSLYFCNNGCKASYQKLAKPVTKEWLEYQYLTLRRNSTEIAHEVKRDPKSVWNWLKDFGIPTRPRGQGLTSDQLSAAMKGVTLGRRHSSESRKRMSDYAKKVGRVPYDPAVGSYMKGRRGPDTPNWKGGHTPERQAFYSTPEWKECVKAVWQRDNAICRRCGLDHRTILRGTIRFELHHVDSFAIVERRADPSNVLLICNPCHKWIHSKKNKRRLFLGKGH